MQLVLFIHLLVTKRYVWLELKQGEEGSNPSNIVQAYWLDLKEFCTECAHISFKTNTAKYRVLIVFPLGWTILV